VYGHGAGFSNIVPSTSQMITTSFKGTA